MGRWIPLIEKPRYTVARLGLTPEERERAEASAARCTSILQVNRLSAEERTLVYLLLVPEQVWNWTPTPGQSPRPKHVAIEVSETWGLARVQVYRAPEDRDPMFYVELADMTFEQIEVPFIMTCDPLSERFHVDALADGRPTYLGTGARNLAEEIRALTAGLAPCQIRRGLRVFKHFLPRAERLMALLGKRSLILDALTYHNALLFEKYGFYYLSGRRLMERIHREFQPGGVLFRQLDGSTPFRRPGAQATIRGRSWAIHDGILGEVWEEPRMAKALGRHAGLCTFPEAVY
jgi:hypothetical protein